MVGAAFQLQMTQLRNVKKKKKKRDPGSFMWLQRKPCGDLSVICIVLNPHHLFKKEIKIHHFLFQSFILACAKLS